MIVWLDGHLVDAEAARIDPTDRGFLLGDGVFETIAIRDGAILRLREHLARLTVSVTELGLPLSSAADLAGEVQKVHAANKFSDGCIRITVTRGPASRGLLPDADVTPTILMVPTACAVGYGTPITAVVARTTRRNEYSPLSRIKSVAYLDNILARQEAIERGADDAILLNTRGLVAEMTVANLFIVQDGIAKTPAIGDGALPGIMRAEVVARLDAEECSLGVADIANAAEAFTTNALGIRPLISIDDRPVGDGEPGPVTKALSDLP